MLTYKEFERTSKLYTLMGDEVLEGNRYAFIIKYLIEVADGGYVISDVYTKSNYEYRYGDRFGNSLLFTYRYSNKSVIFEDVDFLVDKLFEMIGKDISSFLKIKRTQMFDLVYDYVNNFLDLKKKEMEFERIYG